MWWTVRSIACLVFQCISISLCAVNICRKFDTYSSEDGWDTYARSRQLFCGANSVRNSAFSSSHREGSNHLMQILATIYPLILLSSYPTTGLPGSFAYIISFSHKCQVVVFSDMNSFLLNLPLILSRWKHSVHGHPGVSWTGPRQGGMLKSIGSLHPSC